MGPLINLAGRIPTIKRPLSNRFLALCVCLFLILLAAIIYGLHYRIKQQEARRSFQQAQTVASDSATSNRSMVEGSGTASLSGLPVIPPVSTVPAAPQLPVDKPVPPPVPYYPPVTPAFYPMPTVRRESTSEDLRSQRMGRQLEREQQAIEAPTGAQDQHAPSVAPVDPAQAQMAQLRSLFRPADTAGTPILPAALGGSVSLPEESAQGYRSQNAQGEKRQFADGEGTVGDDYLKAARVAPLSRWVVQRGTVIPAALPNQVISDLPGDLIAEVVRDVYDSPTQKFVEVPAGSKLVGEYNSSVSYGQNRVQIVWTAIYFPDGSFIDLDRMPSHSADGATGLKDQTDNHWKRTIAGVALSSLLSAGLQVSQNRTNGSVLSYPSTGQVIASGVGTQASQLGQQVTNRNLNVQPTLRIRPGEIFAVSVKKDILFPGPYEPMEVR